MNILSKFQVPSSNDLEMLLFLSLGKKGSGNQLIYDKSSTAPATPDLKKLNYPLCHFGFCSNGLDPHSPPLYLWTPARKFSNLIWTNKNSSNVWILVILPPPFSWKMSKPKHKNSLALTRG